MKRTFVYALLWLLAGCSNASIDWQFYYPFPPFRLLGQDNFYEMVGQRYGLNGPGKAVYRSGHTIIADTGNHRVLIWDGLPNGRRPSVVLGQASDGSGYANFEGTSARTMNSPKGVDYDGTYLVVADSGNNRVLIWDSFPTATGQPADHVLGQPDFTSNATPVFGSDHHFYSNPGSVSLAAGQLAISDSVNKRVIYWPSVADAEADHSNFVIVGQASETGTSGGCSANLFLGSPTGVFLNDAGAHPSLLVVDAGAGRVLRFNLPLAGNGPSAPNVFGQVGTATCNSAPVDANTYHLPSDVYAAGDALFLVADTQDYRVLQRSTPDWTTDGGGADTVFNQSSMSTVAPNGFSISSVTNVFNDGTNNWFTDPGHNRVELWSTSGTSPNRVIGQPWLNGVLPNSGPPTASYLRAPAKVLYDGQHLIVVDKAYQRVLIWNRIPKHDNAPADVVLGQADFTSLATTTNPFTGMVQPYGVASDGQHLYVSDTGANRVMIWSTFPVVNNQSPDGVLGQNDLTTISGILPANLGGVNQPEGIALHAGHLYLADALNNRVLVWNTPPTGINPAPDAVIGQFSFGAVTSSTSQTGMSAPSAVFADDRYVYVSNASRVTGYALPLPTFNAPAEFVLGQSSFFTDSANLGGLSAASLSGPRDVISDGTHLWVADTGNYRVLKWNSIPSGFAQPADVVYGEPDFTAIQFGSGPNQLNHPYGLTLLPDRLLVADFDNQRVISFGQDSPAD